MSKISLTNLVNLQNETTAVNAINANNAVLISALDNTLSRNGADPNTMSSNLDMNGSQIINLPSPATAHSPARLVDVTGTGPLISVPPVGTSGGVVGLLNSNLTFDGSNTFNGDADFEGTVSLNGASTLGNLIAMEIGGAFVAGVTGSGTNMVLSISPTITGTLAAQAITGTTTTFSGIANHTNTTNATSAANGALIVAGGVGITKDVWVAGAYTGAFVGVNGTTDATSITTGVLKSAGGASVTKNLYVGGAMLSVGATGGVGYGAGAGGGVSQITSRTTGVTINKMCGAITLLSATGSATPASFTVTNSNVAVNDTIILSQKSGTDKYNLLVTAVAAGSFVITSFTTGGTTTESPVFNFTVIKSVNS